MPGVYRATATIMLSAVAILLIVATGCAPAPAVAPAPRGGPAPVSFAVSSPYLTAQYDRTVGLYREAPRVARNTYWVYSDAYLAGVDVSGWHVPPFRRWTVLVEQAVLPEDVFRSATRVIELGNGVRSEVEDPQAARFADWQEYGDRLLLAALNARNAGNTARERELMAIADGMWDGTGLRDKVHRVRGFYETYKTALYFYMTGDSDARAVLLGLREQARTSDRYGGVYTEYGEDGAPLPGADTNIETTSVTLRALMAKGTDERTDQ